MFLCGHIGIGRRLVQPWRARLPAVPLVIGTLLPDLIDKPLYYLRVSDFFSCTRTIGHTGVLLGALASAAAIRRSRALAALAAGAATHLVLDAAIGTFFREPDDSIWRAFAWPFVAGGFARHAYESVGQHLAGLVAPAIVAAEIAGLMILAFEWRQNAPRLRASKSSRLA